ncbi:hypothetical protein A6R68_22161, partial [Neotoma lepida]
NHLDATKLDFQIERFICKRKQYICNSDGFCIRNLKKKNLLLTAQALVVIDNTVDVSVIISRSGQDPEEMEKEEQAVAEKEMTMSEL